MPTPQFISPGVFTTENDLSFLPQGIANIGAAFIGPTAAGPAFKPTIVQSNQDFVNRFGNLTPNYYTPYAVQNYLKEATQATVIRVLGLNGYSNTLAPGLVLQISGAGGQYTLGFIHPSQQGVALPTGSIGAATGSTGFTLIVSGASGTTTFTSMSIDPTSPLYWANILGNTANNKYDGFAYTEFPQAQAFITGALQGSASVKLLLETGELNFSGSANGKYSNAFTPFIRSQFVGGQRFDLFQCFTLTDGNAANSFVKISIANVKSGILATDWGTFSLLVRQFNDTDASPIVLEQYDNITLNPLDANFILQRIGDSHTVIDANGVIYQLGDFPRISKYIYVQMATGYQAFPNTVLPYGFEPLATPINRKDVPAGQYITTRYSTPTGGSGSVANNRTFYGFNFADITATAYLMGLPSGSVGDVGVFASASNGYPNGGPDAGFDLLTMLAGSDATDIAISSPSSQVASAYRRFSVPFQGGFDGQSPSVIMSTGANITSNNLMGFDLSTPTADGATAYNTAIQILSDKDTYDINLLVMPGVVNSMHSYVVQQGITMCENRADAFYILDGDVLGASENSIIANTQALDSSYAATYHPWVKIPDEVSNKNIWVPPSVVMPGVFAFSDRIGAEWYAPAGLRRGGIPNALQVRQRLAQSDRDLLYDNRVNPIAIFPREGITVWGQKTLQHLASALDRINVRRLLINIKKFFASTGRYLVFEQNTQSARNQFLSVVNPYLASIVQRNGLYAFKVVMDDTNNTPDLIDQNILVGTIYLQPTKTAEYINFTFNILATGATITGA